MFTQSKFLARCEWQERFDLVGGRKEGKKQFVNQHISTILGEGGLEKVWAQEKEFKYIYKEVPGLGKLPVGRTSQENPKRYVPLLQVHQPYWRDHQGYNTFMQRFYNKFWRLLISSGSKTNPARVSSLVFVVPCVLMFR